jgi:hypothetical protein
MGLPCAPDSGDRHGEAEFTGYSDKVVDTVLGRVTLRRTWYHCAGCKHGPRREIPGSASRARPGALRKAARTIPAMTNLTIPDGFTAARAGNGTSAEPSAGKSLTPISTL